MSRNVLQAGQKLLISLGGLVLLLLIFRLFVFFSAGENDDRSYNDHFRADYKIYALSALEKLDFCGEQVPLYDQDIYERLDKELLSNTYYQSNTLLYFKRANRWFPVIEPILKKYGIPNDFKYLPLVESNLTNVVSPAGATGYWQLMKSTAKAYNLEVNDVVDERYDIKLAAEAACKYLKTAYREFKNWTLAAAAYNMGIDGIKGQLSKQNTDNYYDLYLNTETSRYVFRLLAIKEILSNPDKYGYNFRKKDLYRQTPVHTIKIDTAIANLATFAKAQNINYRILKIHNPWLRKNSLPRTTGKQYELLIPDSGYYTFTKGEPDSSMIPADSLSDKLITDSIGIPGNVDK